MSVEHHDLVHELPEFKQRIHQLKTESEHFRRLFDEYHHLTRSIENMENEVSPASTDAEEAAKKQRLHLKDQMFAMLSENAASI